PRAVRRRFSKARGRISSLDWENEHQFNEAREIWIKMHDWFVNEVGQNDDLLRAVKFASQYISDKDQS
ncbi:hypothetical protein MUP65_01475, partial [Patescibacteria group bacterium]|nr:hypothetical protein [Patescibacteria group bacterium]